MIIIITFLSLKEERSLTSLSVSDIHPGTEKIEISKS